MEERIFIVCCAQNKAEITADSSLEKGYRNLPDQKQSNTSSLKVTPSALSVRSILELEAEGYHRRK